MQTSDDEASERDFVADQWMIPNAAGLGPDDRTVSLDRRDELIRAIGARADLKKHLQSGTVIDHIVGVDAAPQFAAGFTKGSSGFGRGSVPISVSAGGFFTTEIPFLMVLPR